MFSKQTKKPPTKPSPNVVNPSHIQEKSKQSDLPFKSTVRGTGRTPSNKPNHLQEKKQNPEQPEKLLLQPATIPEVQQSDLLSPKIQSKVMFLTVKITSMDQAKQIRVKCWKLKSYHLGKNPFTSSRVVSKMSPEYDEGDGKYKSILQYFLGATLKKSLKFTKRFNFINQKDLSLSNFKKLFLSMSKVQNIAITINDFRKSSDIFLKNYLNPQTTQLTLRLLLPLALTRPQDSLMKYITLMKRLRKCENVLQMPEFPDMELMKLKSPIRFCKSKEKTFFNQITKTVSKSLEEISIEDYNLPLQSRKILASPKSGLQNLKKLRVVVGTGRLTDISWIENSPNLQSLTIKIINTKIASFDFLAHLSQLQELSIISREYPSTFQLPYIPPIATLRKFTVFLRKSSFHSQNIQKVIASSKNLEVLNLTLDFKEILLILQQEIKLPLLQELTLRDLDRPSDEPYPSLAFQKILARYKHVARLTLDLGFSFSILKPLEQLTNLTHLSIRNTSLFKEKPQKLAPLKELFTNLKVLKSLQINLIDSWVASEELTNLVSDLRFLQNLKSLEFRVYLKKNWSEHTLIKLANFLKSFQHLKKVDIKASGFDGEKDSTIIGSIIIQNIQFWEKVDYFDLYPLPELYL